MSSIVFQTTWCSGSRAVSVAESSTMSAQHKQTPGDLNVLGLRVEHQEVNHHQSVGSCVASDDVAVTQDTLACLHTVPCVQT